MSLGSRRLHCFGKMPKPAGETLTLPETKPAIEWESASEKVQANDPECGNERVDACETEWETESAWDE
jgi:hypothetical protein